MTLGAGASFSLGIALGTVVGLGLGLLGRRQLVLELAGMGIGFIKGLAIKHHLAADGAAQLELLTDAGIIGRSIPSGNWSVIENDVFPRVKGENPFFVERIWDRMYHHNRKPVAKGDYIRAMGAVDIWSKPGQNILARMWGGIPVHRGEYDRAIRMHQNLLDRPDLPKDKRETATFELAQDFHRAGLLDRAEELYTRLEGSPFEHASLGFLLSIYEQEKDWPKAIAVTRQMEAIAKQPYFKEIAHYDCELAQAALLKNDHAAATGYIEQALAESGLDPGTLVIEMTESVIMQHTEATLAKLTRLKRRKLLLKDQIGWLEREIDPDVSA